MADTKNCEWCGATYSRQGLTYRPKRAEWAARRFCSRGCKDTYRAAEWAKAAPSHPDSGRRIARQTYAAVACERCGATTGLVRHHRNENTIDNAAANIEILCRACHMTHHKTLVLTPEEEAVRHEHKRRLGRAAEARYREKTRAARP